MRQENDKLGMLKASRRSFSRLSLSGTQRDTARIGGKKAKKAQVT